MAGDTGRGHHTPSHLRNQCEAIQRAGTRRSSEVAFPTPTLHPIPDPSCSEVSASEVLEIPKFGALNYFRILHSIYTYNMTDR